MIVDIIIQTLAGTGISGRHCTLCFRPTSAIAITGNPDYLELEFSGAIPRPVAYGESASVAIRNIATPEIGNATLPLTGDARIQYSYNMSSAYDYLYGFSMSFLSVVNA
jgi:hypothetical protein